MLSVYHQHHLFYLYNNSHLNHRMTSMVNFMATLQQKEFHISLWTQYCFTYKICDSYLCSINIHVAYITDRI